MARRHWIPMLCFIGALPLYLGTLAPSVGFVDSGELSAVCATLGVAHPTGYPLYTNLGHLFTRLPIGSIAIRTNVFSAVCSALTVGIIAWIVLALLSMESSISSGKGGSGKSRGERDGVRGWIFVIAAVIAAGYIGFSTVHWIHAVTTEVYALTVLLVALLLGGLLLWFPRGDGGSGRRWVYLWCYLWGLGFGNHMIIVFLAPVVLVALIIFRTHYRTPVKTFVIGGLFFLLGITICLYIPVRSLLNPVLDWGDPQTLERFWNHLTAKQYRIWMFSQGFGVMANRFAASLGHLWHWISPPGVLLAVVGFVVSWLDRPKLNGILLTLLLADLIYSLNYDIPDIDPYYLPSHVVVAIWAGLGGYSTLSALHTRGKRILIPVAIVLLATLIWPAAQHWSKASHRGDVLAESLGKYTLDSLPEDALAVHAFWDTQSIGRYLQLIEGYRQDVALIDMMLMERSWYVRQQVGQYPDVFEGLDREVSDFLRVVSDFEGGRAFDAMKIERSWIAMMNGMLERNLDRRRVFVGFLEKGKHPDFAKGFQLAPREVFFEVNPANVEDEEISSILDLDFRVHPEWVRTQRTRWFIDQLAWMAMFTAEYRLANGDYDGAVQSVNRALQFKPGDPQIIKIRDQLRNRGTKIEP